MTRFHMLSCATAVMFTAGCSVTVPYSTYGCTTAHGGDPYKCWQALQLDRPRPARGASYHSAGTMSLAHATCVRAKSQWWFHGAHNPKTGAISHEGNEVLKNAYQMRYPKVVQYLDSHKSLETTSWTKLSGTDLNNLGVPLCER